MPDSRRADCALILRIVLGLWASAPAATSLAASATEVVDLSKLSIDELSQMQVSSASRKDEPLANVPASVFVITRDDIRRSGATSVPEALRLAPTLQVARVNASQYAITSRGFNGTTANKLLVMIDGRSVYTPLYSGVFWDVQDVMLEDIDRIEVISGAGGTLWGSNAVNGVINIITRNAHDTQGALVVADGGNRENSGAARYGSMLGEDIAVRLYAKHFRRDSTVLENGQDAGDAFQDTQGGFRVDGISGHDAFTVQADVYNGSIDQLASDRISVSGGNLLGRWNRTLGDSSSLRVQGYFDQTSRNYPGAFAERLDTFDLDLQHRFAWGGRHDVVWGGGTRVSLDDVTNSSVLAFLPPKRTLNLSNLFAQDTIALSGKTKLTAGVKAERNTYTGLEWQPNLRLAVELTDHSLLWSALARAVRTPSRIDRDLFSPAMPPYLLAGGTQFRSEKVIAFEVGYRSQPTSDLLYSLTGFANRYDDLRTVEPTTVVGPPFVLANKLHGTVYGLEAWSSYQVMSGWRLRAGATLLSEHLRPDSDSLDPSAVSGAGNDPKHQGLLRSSIDLASNVGFDLTLRSVGRLPNPAVPAYTAVDARLGWSATPKIELSVTGTNLFDGGHPEFGTPATRSQIGRGGLAKLEWRL